MKRFLFIIIALTLFFLLATNVFAANYYVKNAGNDNNTGLSDAQAWATVSKVRNAGLVTDSCVYFKCGDTWNTKTDATLRINWSGTNDANRAIIGAYYMDSGSETVGVNVDGKPVLDGGWDTNQSFQIIIQPYGAHYIIIQDLKLYNSYRYGIRGSSTAASSYVTMKRLRIDYMGGSGLYSSGLGTNGILEYCDISRTNLLWYLGLSPTWGASVAIKTDNFIARYNQVHEVYGEGINIGGGDDVDNVIVENNLVWATQSVGIYMDGSRDGIVRNNVVLGTTDTAYHQSWVYGGRTWNPVGIGFNNETVNDSSLRNKVYGNVVIGHLAGIQSINKTGETVGYANRQLVYNNTFIDNFYNINTHVNELMNTEYKNNVSIIHTDAAAIGSKHVWHSQNVGPTSCYRPLGNFWSSAPQFAVWEHASDVVGDAKLFKTSGWQSISTPSDIDIAEAFALTTGSDAIDSAQDLGATYDDIFLEGTDFNVTDASDASTPIVVVLGDQDSYGAGWEWGAVIWNLMISGVSPSQGATGISITTDPNWTNPTGENTNDGYFKVGACPCDAGDSVWTNQAHQTSYDPPGTLAYNTAHCWRVDIDHDGGTEAGTNYGFTTTSQANPPTPEGSGIVWHKQGVKTVHGKGLEIQ